jgi:hypothetical protein
MVGWSETPKSPTPGKHGKRTAKGWEEPKSRKRGRTFQKFPKEGTGSPWSDVALRQASLRRWHVCRDEGWEAMRWSGSGLERRLG